VFFPVFADVVLVLPVLGLCGWGLRLGLRVWCQGFPGPTERPGPVLESEFTVQEAFEVDPAAQVAHQALFFATPR
jgi:hypothetical protein